MFYGAMDSSPEECSGEEPTTRRGCIDYWCNREHRIEDCVLGYEAGFFFGDDRHLYLVLRDEWVTSGDIRAGKVWTGPPREGSR
jgi:hypothetical protein